MLLLCALIAGSGSVWGQVSSASPEDGKSYVVACYQSNKYYALGTASVSGKTIDGTVVTLNSLNKVNTTDAASLTWTLEENSNSTGEFFLKCNRNGTYYYLYKNGTGNKNYNFATNSSSNKTSWSFTANNAGTAYTLAATDRGTTYNVNIQCEDGTFRCYSSASDIILLEIGDVPAGPVDLTSFAFGTTSDAVQLNKNGSTWEASYTQTVTVDPDDYDGTVAYSIDEDASTIGENTLAEVSTSGVVTIIADANEASTIVVKASGTATSSYNKPDDVTYTLTIHPAPAGVGTPTFTLTEGAYYYGTTVEIASVNSSEIRYTVDGSEPTSSSTLYSTPIEITSDFTLKAKGFDGALESTVASADYTVKAPQVPSFSVDAGAVAKGTSVTLTVGEGGSDIMYTTDGTDPSFAGDNGEIYSEPIVINYGQTIKAISIDGGYNESAVAEATYTLTMPTGSLYYTLMTDVEELADGASILIASEADGEGNLYLMSTDQKSNNRGAVAATVTDGKITTIPETAQVIELEASESYWYFKVGDDQYLYASSGSSNQLKTATKSTVSSNGQATVAIDEKNVTSVVFNRTGRNTMQYNYNGGSPLFNCYASASQSAVQIYIQKTDEPTETVTVTSNGWASYIPSYAVEFPADRAYVVTAVNGNKIEVTAVSKVPARTPVLLKGEGEVTVGILNEEVTAPAKNLLSIGTGTVAAGEYPYVLAKDGDSAGFKLWTGAASVLKNRVVLMLDEKVSNARQFFFLDDDSETTGITNNNRETITNDGEYFNLAGQRIGQPTKGLYIVNGKKVVIK